MVKKSITYSLPVLKNLVASETSFVYCYENCKRCFFANPLQLVNIKNAVNEHLKSKITTYDAELKGIILSHKNIKVINSVQLNDDGEFSLDYIADIYVFKPNTGNILTGRVNKKSQDHLGVLVHSVFNATLPRPRNEDECPKTWVSHIKIGDQVKFEVVKVNFLGRLPYIEGKLVEVEERDTEDGDSGIGGHESTEEGIFNKRSPMSDSFVTNGIGNVIKSNMEGKISSNIISPVQSRMESSVLDLQSSLLNEALGRSNFSNLEVKADNKTSIVDDSSSSKPKSTKEKRTSKKRKSSFFLEIENSLLKSAVENLKDPELSNECVPKVKQEKMSVSENPESTIDHLISSEISSLTPTKKRKLSIDENFNSPGLSDECLPKVKKKKISGSEDVRKYFQKVSQESTIDSLISSEISSLTPAKKKLSISVSEVNLLKKDSSSIENVDENCSSPGLSNECLPKMKKKKVSGSGDVRKYFQKESQESAIDSLISSEISSLTPAKKKLSISVSEVNSQEIDNSSIKNADENFNSPGLSNECLPKMKKKKKSGSEDLNKFVQKESSESTNDSLISSEISALIPAKNKLNNDVSEVNLSHKKHKKKKSKEASFIEEPGDLQPENKTVLASETDFELGSKKKKKSVSFLDPEISSVDYIEDRFSEITPSEEREDKNNEELDKEIVYAQTEHKKRKKKRSTLVLNESPSYLLNSIESNPEGEVQNIDGEVEQSNSNGLIKKKKKKSHSFKQLEENLLNNTTDDVNYELNDNQNIEDQDLHYLSKEHKKKKKKKSSSSLETGHLLNCDYVNSQDTSVVQQDTPNREEHRKKKKKHSSILSDASYPEVGISFSEELSENKLDISSTNETTEVKLKKKKKKKSRESEMENYV